jgi:broad specificity phosphatase PhoE
MQILLIRHGQTEWNASNILQGQTDVPLSDLGVSQVERLRPTVRAWGPDLAWISPLIRARQTADILLDGLAPLEIEHLPALMERANGCLEGLTRDQQAAQFPQVLHALRQDPVHAPIPGGESLSDFWQRVVPVMDHPVSARRLAIIAHGGSIRVLISHFLGLGVSHPVRARFDNACYSLAQRLGVPPAEVRYRVHSINVQPN